MTVVVADSVTFGLRLPELVAVYKAAFLDLYEPDPMLAAAQRRAHMERHINRTDLRLATVDEPDGLQGFCYSYRGGPGQWWHDIVSSALDPTMARRWLADCREIVELHVLPAAQGRGLGRQLLRAALDGTPERTAALSARADPDSRARRLYASEGFRPLLDDFRFPGGATRYVVLAKDRTPPP